MTADWPDFTTYEEAKAALDYPDYRAWYADVICERPYPKTWKRRAVKPPPGVYDLAAEDEG